MKRKTDFDAPLSLAHFSVTKKQKTMQFCHAFCHQKKKQVLSWSNDRQNRSGDNPCIYFCHFIFQFEKNFHAHYWLSVFTRTGSANKDTSLRLSQLVNSDILTHSFPQTFREYHQYYEDTNY